MHERYPTIQEGKKYAHSIRELASELKWSTSKVMKAKKAGVIPFGQNGRKVIFDLQKVHEAIQTQGMDKGEYVISKRSNRK